MNTFTKHLITAFLACVLAVGVTYFVLDGVYKRNIADIRDSYAVQMYELKLEKDSVKIAFDSVTTLMSAYEAELATLVKKAAVHKAEIDHLETELKKALNWVFDALIDENYEYLQNRFPPEDSLEYPFAGNQVKSMAMAIVEGDYKDSIISEQKSLERIIRERLTTNSIMLSTLYKERNDFEFLTAHLYDQLAIMAKENQLTEEEAARLKKALNKWRIGGLGTMGFAALLLILL